MLTLKDCKTHTWVRLPDGATGRIIGHEGAAVRVYNPETRRGRWEGEETLVEQIEAVEAKVVQVEWPKAVGGMVIGMGHHMGWGEKIPDNHYGIWRISDGKILAASSDHAAVLSALSLLLS